MRRSVETYQTVLRINPDDAAAHYNLGNAYRQKCRLDQAISEYQAALRIDPDDVRVACQSWACLCGPRST